MELLDIDAVAEKRCFRCREIWPADTEFFHRLTDGRLHSYCKACVHERGKELRSGAVRLVRRFPKIERGLPWWLLLNPNGLEERVKRYPDAISM